MKRKILSLVLVLVLLLPLSACKKTNLQIPNSRKDVQKLSSVEDCHLLLRLSINPQFEIYLDENAVVLKVTGGNTDGKKLLADMELTGLLYDDAVKAILDAAAAQGFLKDNAHIQIDVLAGADDALTYEESRKLGQAVTEYDDSLSVFVDQSAVIAAEYGADLIEVEHWENGDVWYSYFYQWTLLRETLYAADGSYSDYVYDGKKTLSAIFITPDGNRTEQHCTYDDAGLVLTHRVIMQEGDNISIEEERFTYDDAGVVLTRQHVWQEGDFTSTVDEWFEDGVLTRSLEATDGCSVERYYDENGNIAHSLEMMDGCSIEHYYDENGNITHSLEMMDGRSIERYYDENGNITHSLEMMDGRSIECYYGENGNITHSLEVMDGATREQYYDEYGNITRSLEVMDGATQERYYDTNGVCSYAYDTFPNGDWRKEIYYPNGVKKSEEGISDGVYYSFFYNEQGQQIQ